MHTFIAVVGRFHNLVLHFPIALVTTLAFVQVVLRGRIPDDRRRVVVGWLLGLAAVSAVLASATGLAFMSDETFRGEELAAVQQHRNNGIVTSLIVIAAAVAHWRAGPKVALGLLLWAALGVAFTGHSGGTVVHGADYYSQPFEEKKAGAADDDDSPRVASDGDEPGDVQARERYPEGKVPDKVDYARDIKPIFDRSCTKCHGPEKRKSGLRLDRKRFALKGGETGPAIVPGDVEKSLVAKYIQLPVDDDDVMPSKGKLLANSEIETIKKWIAAGAEWPDDPE